MKKCLFVRLCKRKRFCEDFSVVEVTILDEIVFVYLRWVNLLYC